MHQYLELCRRIVDEGVWIENERTGKRCLTVINADLSYDVGGNKRRLLNCLDTCAVMAAPRNSASWALNRGMPMPI